MLNSCSDPLIRERLEFQCSALHIHGNAAHAAACQIKQVEQLAANRNCGEYFGKRLLELLGKAAHQNGSCNIGSHIQVLLGSQIPPLALTVTEDGGEGASPYIVRSRGGSRVEGIATKDDGPVDPDSVAHSGGMNIDEAFTGVTPAGSITTSDLAFVIGNLTSASLEPCLSSHGQEPNCLLKKQDAHQEQRDSALGESPVGCNNNI
ncbi:unnamed protein product [Calypogeia fissa]